MLKNKTLLCISYSTCPTVYVNRHLSCLTYGRVPTKGRNYVRTRNLRIETNTDGSRDKNKVAAAAVINKDVCFLLDSQMRRLNFFSKSKGNWTCFWAYRYVQIYTFKIYIFRFTFLFLHSMKIDRPYILDTLYTYCFVSNQGKIVNCCCIPSHIDIHGNMKQIRLQNLHSTSKILSIFYYTLYKLSLAYILGLL